MASQFFCLPFCSFRFSLCCSLARCLHLNLPIYVPFPFVDAVCRAPAFLFPGEAGDIPLFLDHSGLLCLIHGLVSLLCLGWVLQE